MVPQKNFALRGIINWCLCAIATFDSSPSAWYMRRLTGSSLVQTMVCRLFGAKPSSESMMIYHINQTYPNEQTSIKEF